MGNKPSIMVRPIALTALGFLGLTGFCGDAKIERWNPMRETLTWHASQRSNAPQIQNRVPETSASSASSTSDFRDFLEIESQPKELIERQSRNFMIRVQTPLQGPPPVSREDLAISNMVIKDEATRKLRDEYAAQCMTLAAAEPKTGDGVADMRCSMVSFEVCLNRTTGIISQSQGAAENCHIAKDRAGPGACQAPCAAAALLPVGGSGKAGRYTGLTPAAVACYRERIVMAGRQSTPATKACAVNGVVTGCLYNGSASPAVNAAILEEAQAGCENYKQRFPNETCSACTSWQLNHTN